MKFLETVPDRSFLSQINSLFPGRSVHVFVFWTLTENPGELVREVTRMEQSAGCVREETGAGAWQPSHCAGQDEVPRGSGRVVRVSVVRSSIPTAGTFHNSYVANLIQLFKMDADSVSWPNISVDGLCLLLPVTYRWFCVCPPGHCWVLYHDNCGGHCIN